MNDAQNLEQFSDPAAGQPQTGAEEHMPPAAGETQPEGNAQPTQTIRVSGYEMYVRRRQQQETAIFTWIGGTMVALLVLSLLVFFGILPVPFLNSFKAEPQIAKAGDVPCPLSKQPVSPEKITARVVNGTGTSGLAKEVAAGLEARKVTVKSIGNINTGKYEGDVRITAGPAGINAAYTLARAFDDVEIILDPRPTNDVTVTIGAQYADMIPAEEFADQAAGPLEARDGCVPVSTD